MTSRISPWAYPFGNNETAAKKQKRQSGVRFTARTPLQLEGRFL